MHYVCSDIHGQYNKFLKLLKKIDFSEKDEMYIIGDVIDRGPHPIDVLMHIITSSNMHLLIGNHEHMMLSARTDADRQLWKKNGSDTTLRQLERLPSNMKDFIFKTLEKQPIAIPDLMIKGRHYYLVHAMPLPFIIDKPLLYNQTINSVAEEVLWSRHFTKDGEAAKTILKERIYNRYRGYRLIVGHTPTPMCSYAKVTKAGKGRISWANHGHLINIDCGCAGGQTLGCLRLEDHHEFYID